MPMKQKKVITQQFKEIYKNYFYSTDEEFMIGTQSSAVKCWDGYIVQDFSWGDSTFAFGAIAIVCLLSSIISV